MEAATIIKRVGDTGVCKKVFSDLTKAKSYARKAHLTGYITYRLDSNYTIYPYEKGKLVLKAGG